MIAPPGAKQYLCSHGYARKDKSRRNRGRRRVDPERITWPDESRRAHSFGVRIWRRIPELRRTGTHHMSDRGHPDAGNVRSGTPIEAKRKSSQNSYHLYYGARRRKNADASFEGGSSEVYD